MAVEKLDGVGHYDTIPQMAGKWNDTGVNTAISIGTNPHGGNEIALSGGQIFMTLSYQPTWTCMWRENFGGAGWGPQVAIWKFSSNGTTLAGLYVEPDGSLTLYAGEHATFIANSGTLTPPFYLLQGRVSYHFAIKVVLTGSNPIIAAVTLKLNNLVLLSGSGSTGVNNAGLYAGSKGNRFDWFNPVTGGFAPAHLCDFLWVNPTGGTYQGFIGDVKIDTRFPATLKSNTAFPPWAPNIGTLVDAVNEQYPNGDVNYDFSGALGRLDFIFQPIPAFTGDIVAQQLLAYARKDDEGTKLFGLTVNGGIVGPNDISPGDTYSYASPLCMDQDPILISPWTLFNANTYNYGIEETA